MASVLSVLTCPLCGYEVAWPHATPRPPGCWDCGYPELLEQRIPHLGDPPPLHGHWGPR